MKRWCPLCLSVQAVLALELTWSIINYWQQPFMPVVSLLIVALPIVFCFLVPFILWYIVRPLILKAKEEPIYQAAYKRLLYNPDIFNNLLQQQATAPDGYQNIGITIGNPKAKNKLIKVCNPYCGHCSRAHQTIWELLDNNQDVQVQMIFNVTNNKEDIMALPVKHFLAIAEKNDETLLKKALDDWYLSPKKDYAAFAEKYPLNGTLIQQEHGIEKMSEWCKEANITGTPTLFINDQKLPEKYKIEELKYIL